MHKRNLTFADDETKQELTADDLPALNQELDKGRVVEIMKLRNGSVKARTVMKKEIQLPTVR